MRERRTQFDLVYWAAPTQATRSSWPRWLFVAVVAVELCFKSWRLFKAIQHPPEVLKPESYLAGLLVMVLLYASMLILTFAQRMNPTPVVVIIVLQLYFMCIGGVGAMLKEDFQPAWAKLAFATYIIWHVFTIAVAVFYLKRMPPRP